MRKTLLVWYMCMAALLYAPTASFVNTTADSSPMPDVVRLHVLANSDSPSDQLLKLRARDEVLAACAGLDDPAAIAANLPRFEAAARAALRSQGCRDSVRAEWGVFDFPARQYGGALYPAGRYRAVRIIIGEGRGQNWWCVLFPPLCRQALFGAMSEEEKALYTAAEKDGDIRFVSRLGRWWRKQFEPPPSAE